jgi:hypothetical protein
MMNQIFIHIIYLTYKTFSQQKKICLQKINIFLLLYHYMTD